MLKGKQEEGSPAETTGRLAQTLGRLPTEGETSEKGVAETGAWGGPDGSLPGLIWTLLSSASCGREAWVPPCVD